MTPKQALTQGDRICLVSDAVRSIVGYIREAKLEPGDRLPSENAFVQKLGVSRTVIREAFRSLSALSIINQHAGRRAEVAKISFAPVATLIEHGVHTEQVGVREIYDVRRVLEARIVALAALHRTPQQAERIKCLAALMRRHADDPGKLMDYDRTFHEELAKASKNRVYELILRSFRSVTEKTWPIGWRTRVSNASRENILRIHKEIADAVEAGDPKRASTAMDNHFDDSLSNLDRAGVI